MRKSLVPLASFLLGSSSRARPGAGHDEHADVGPPRLRARRPASGFRADFLVQLDMVGKQIVDLAEAVPADKYSWRPAPGVRSVSEVYMHIVGGNSYIPGFLGVKPMAGIDAGHGEVRDGQGSGRRAAQEVDGARAVGGPRDARRRSRQEGQDLRRRRGERAGGDHDHRQPPPRAPRPVDRVRAGERDRAPLVQGRADSVASASALGDASRRSHGGAPRRALSLDPAVPASGRGRAATIPARASGSSSWCLVMQACYWGRRRLPATHGAAASHGHVLLFLSRLAFVFVGSSFSLFIVRCRTLRRRSGDLLSIWALFAIFCYVLELEAMARPRLESPNHA